MDPAKLVKEAAMAAKALGRAVVFTALDVEYEALRHQLSSLAKSRPLQDDGGWETAVLANDDWEWEITLAEVGQGNTSAATECQRAIDRVHPQLVLFVGVAGSLRPDELGIGDVVLATKVAAFHGGRDDGRFHARPIVYQCSYRVIQLARTLRRKHERDAWLKLLQPPPQQPPSVHLKPVAAGDVVLASSLSSTRALLEEHFDDAVAVEMESAGMLHAAYANEPLSAAVVRGISDVLDDRDREDRRACQELAARNAAAFASVLLTQLDPRPLTPPADRPASGRGPKGADTGHEDQKAERVVHADRYYERTQHSEHNYYG